MTLEEFVIKILDTQNDPPNGMSRADYLAEGFEQITRCIYHDEDELEDFFTKEELKK